MESSSKQPFRNDGQQIFFTFLILIVSLFSVTFSSWWLPRSMSGLVVSIIFLLPCGWMILKHDTTVIRKYGFSFGGLFEPEPVAVHRLGSSFAVALVWSLLAMALFFPAYWIGFCAFWKIHPLASFAFRWPSFDQALGHLGSVALPEEAFFRGFLQTKLDDIWPPRWMIFRAKLGPSWIFVSLVFAMGHFMTLPQPARLLVFFPSLIFGWMRAKTGGIGSGAIFHASCNLFSAFMVDGYYNQST